MRIACSLAARRPEPPMRPMIRLGNLNARPSCPAAAPGSTVWVYLYAAGHRDIPGDSPAGNRRLSGTRAQDGEIADTCANENRRPVERVDSMAWGRNFPGRNRSGMPIHRAHTGAIKNRPGERTADRRHGAGIHTSRNRTLRSRTHLQGTHLRHRKTAARKTGGGWICGRLRR